MADTATAEAPDAVEGSEDFGTPLGGAFDAVWQGVETNHDETDKPTEGEQKPQEEQSPEPEKKPETEKPKEGEPGYDSDRFFKEKEKPAEEQKPEVSEEPPAELKTEEARKNFQRLTQLRKEAEAQVKKLAEENEQLKQNSTASQELQERLAAIEKERDELQQIAERTRFEYHPEFKKLSSRQEQLQSEAVNHIKESGGDVEAFQRALSLRGRARSEALQEAYDSMLPRDQTRAEAILAEVERTSREIEEARSKHTEKLTEWERQEQEQSAKQQKEIERKKAEVFEAVASKGSEAYLLMRDPEEAARIKSEAQEILTSQRDYGYYADVAVRAAQVAPLQKMLEQERQGRIKAENALRQLQAAEPDIAGTSRESSKPEAKSWADDVINRMQGE